MLILDICTNYIFSLIYFRVMLPEERTYDRVRFDWKKEMAEASSKLASNGRGREQLE